MEFYKDEDNDIWASEPGVGVWMYDTIWNQWSQWSPIGWIDHQSMAGYRLTYGLKPTDRLTVLTLTHSEGPKRKDEPG